MTREQKAKMWRRAHATNFDVTTIEGQKEWKKRNAKRLAHEEMLAKKSRESK